MQFSGDWTYKVKEEKTVAGHEVYDFVLDGDGSVEMEIPSLGTAIMDYTVEGYRHVRISDLATVKDVMSLDMSTSIAGIELSIRMSFVMSFDPPENDFGFPLDVGKEWNSTSSVESTSTFIMTMGDDTTTETDSDTSSESTSYKCESMETISVPAGTFESYKIKESEDGEGYVYTYVSEKSGLFVKSELYDDEGDLGMVMKLKSYSFGEGQGAFAIMDYWWLLILIIVIVVALVTVAAVRSRRRKEEYPPPPPEYEM
jgi:hypothetical protein